ncbi:MAG: hypothetical protein ACYTKD_20855, partial [Planctomycetota bacterium]
MRNMTRAGLYVRASAFAVMSLLCPSGCVLAQFRQQAVEYSLGATTRARDEIVSAAKATHEIAEELEVAAVEERRPEIAEPVQELATALSSAHPQVVVGSEAHGLPPVVRRDHSDVIPRAVRSRRQDREL